MTLLNAESLLIFSAVLIVIAFLYSSVGHGGASGYLALMALFSLPIAFMKPTALILNIFVSGVAFWYFKKNKHFRWKLFYPFALTSIPAALIGGYLTINATLYKQILGAFLLVAILRMLGIIGGEKDNKRELNIVLALVFGLGIGLFSGLIGIGGGIILSPLIIVLAWGNMKEAAAVSALFIFVNSVAGIAGFLIKNNSIPWDSFMLVPIALIGGTVGAIYGSRRFSNQTLTYLLSFVLLLASIKLFII